MFRNSRGTLPGTIRISPRRMAARSRSGFSLPKFSALRHYWSQQTRERADEPRQRSRSICVLFDGETALMVLTTSVPNLVFWFQSQQVIVTAGFCRPILMIRSPTMARSQQAAHGSLLLPLKYTALPRPACLFHHYLLDREGHVTLARSISGSAALRQAFWP